MPTILLLLTLLASSTAVACELKNHKFLTEHSPPFSYLDQGRVTGLAVDRVRLIAAQAGCVLEDSQFSLLPWDQAYATALKEPKKALFAISKTDSRRPLFHWVGPIGTDIYGVFGTSANRHRFTNLQTSGELIWGVVENDLGEHYAQRLGVDPAKLRRAPHPEALARQLLAGTIQLWIYSQTAVIDTMTGLGAGPADYTMYQMIERNDFYLAFSLDTPQSLIEQLQKSNQALSP